MGIFSDLRVIATLSRSIKQLADEATAVRIQFGFKSLSELRQIAKDAAKEEAERAQRESLGRPSPEDFERNELQLAFDSARDRLRAGEYVDDAELLAAARALADLEGTSDTSNAEY